MDNFTELRNMKIQMSATVLWYVTKCDLIHGYQGFGGTYCFHLQCRKHLGRSWRIVPSTKLQGITCPGFVTELQMNWKSLSGSRLCACETNIQAGPGRYEGGIHVWKRKPSRMLKEPLSFAVSMLKHRYRTLYWSLVISLLVSVLGKYVLLFDSQSVILVSPLTVLSILNLTRSTGNKDRPVFLQSKRI